VSFYSSSVCIKDYRLKKIAFATEIMYSKTLIILTEVLEIMKKNCHKIISIQVTQKKKDKLLKIYLSNEKRRIS